MTTVTISGDNHTYVKITCDGGLYGEALYELIEEMDSEGFEFFLTEKGNAWFKISNTVNIPSGNPLLKRLNSILN